MDSPQTSWTKNTVDMPFHFTDARSENTTLKVAQLLQQYFYLDHLRH